MLGGIQRLVGAADQAVHRLPPSNWLTPMLIVTGIASLPAATGEAATAWRRS